MLLYYFVRLLKILQYYYFSYTLVWCTRCLFCWKSFATFATQLALFFRLYVTWIAVLVISFTFPFLLFTWLYHMAIDLLTTLFFCIIGSFISFIKKIEDIHLVKISINSMPTTIWQSLITIWQFNLIVDAQLKICNFKI